MSRKCYRFSTVFDRYFWRFLPSENGAEKSPLKNGENGENGDEFDREFSEALMKFDKQGR